MSESDSQTERFVDKVREELARFRRYSSDSDRRNQRTVDEVRTELEKIQEDLVSAKVNLQVCASLK